MNEDALQVRLEGARRATASRRYGRLDRRPLVIAAPLRSDEALRLTGP
jgi:hypothetical protein